MKPHIRNSSLIFILILIISLNLRSFEPVKQTTAVPMIEYADSFGSMGTLNGEFNNPYDVAIFGGFLYVVDSSNDRIQKFDLAGNYVSQFGIGGTGDGEFNRPKGILVNGTHILVSDTFNHRLQLFDMNGLYVTQVGSAGISLGQFSQPYGMDMNGTHYFIADSGNHRVQILDLALNSIISIGTPGTSDGQFQFSYDVAVSDSHIYMSDWGNSRIQAFDHGGNYVTKIGTLGNNNTQLSFPYGIEVDGDFLFVGEWGNHRIQVFDVSSGSMLWKHSFGSFGIGNGKFSNPNQLTSNGTHLFVPESGNHRVQILSLNGFDLTPLVTFPTLEWSWFWATIDQSLTSPIAAIIVNDFVYVSNFGTINVYDIVGNYLFTHDESAQTLTPEDMVSNGTHLAVTSVSSLVLYSINPVDGSLIYETRAFGGSLGVFFPEGVAMNQTHFFVTDRTNYRIVVIDSSLEAVFEIGGPNGPYPGQFARITDVAVTDDFIYISDSGTGRVSVYNHGGDFISIIQIGEMNSIHIFQDWLFVQSKSANRIIVYDLNGILLGSLSGASNGPDGFGVLTHISTNGTHLILPDTINDRISIWSINQPSSNTTTITETNTQTATVTETNTETTTETLTGTTETTTITGTEPPFTTTETVTQTDPGVTETTTLTNSETEFTVTEKETFTVTQNITVKEIVTTTVGAAAGDSTLIVWTISAVFTYILFRRKFRG